MPELDILDWIIVILASVFIGISKTGLNSFSILVVTMLVAVFPAKAAMGILLPLLIIGDLIAVFYYRQNIVWRYLIKLIPWVFIGIIVGYFVLDFVSDSQLKPIIGFIILLLIVLNITRNALGEKFIDFLPESKSFTIFIGVLSGFSTMVGNAAGAIMAIYLLIIGLGKRDLVGTAAIFFLIVNLIKVPFYVHLDIINFESLKINLLVFPVIFVGALIGIKILKVIPTKLFRVLILVLATFGAIRLLFV